MGGSPAGAVTVGALLVGALLTGTVIGVAALARTRMLITVDGMSMSPTFQNGDQLLVRRTRGCRVGDIVVFAIPAPFPGAPPWLVKRVVAVAGDPVPPQVRPAVPDSTVPPGRIVVRGDNARSLDSRSLGYISTQALVGVVQRRMGRGC